MGVIADSRPQEPKPLIMSEKYFKWRPCSVYLPVKNGVEWKWAKHDISLLIEKEKRGPTKLVRERRLWAKANKRTNKEQFSRPTKGR